VLSLNSYTILNTKKIFTSLSYKYDGTNCFNLDCNFLIMLNRKPLLFDLTLLDRTLYVGQTKTLNLYFYDDNPGSIS
jgi:hypothetical protein